MELARNKFGPMEEENRRLENEIDKLREVGVILAVVRNYRRVDKGCNNYFLHTQQKFPHGCPGQGIVILHLEEVVYDDACHTFDVILDVFDMTF